MTDEHDEQGNSGTESSSVPEPTEEPKCLTCELDDAIISFSLARTACEFAGDDDEKKSCREWAEGLDPTAIEEFDNIVDETIERVGIEGLSKMSHAMNDKMHSGIIRHVQKRLDSGETVPQDVMNLYKSLSIKRGL